MKIHKGEAGYLKKRKVQLMIELILEASLIGGLLIAGYLLNHTRLNIFTLVAILACLPACRALVNLIMLLPHHSMDEATELEISGVTEYLTMLYDLVITSERKAMPVDAIAISGKTICGYARNKKVDTNYCARHIKSILAQNKIEKVTVKIFHDYVAFLSRAEGMKNIAAVERADQQRLEDDIKQIIMDISL